MSMGEGSALRVLAGEPDRNPVLEERREGEGFRVPPVDAALTEAVVPPFELAQELRIDLEPLGDLEELLAELDEAVRRDCRHDRRARVRLGGRLRPRNGRRKTR